MNQSQRQSQMESEQEPLVPSLQGVNTDDLPIAVAVLVSSNSSSSSEDNVTYYKPNVDYFGRIMIPKGREWDYYDYIKEKVLKLDRKLHNGFEWDEGNFCIETVDPIEVLNNLELNATEVENPH